MTDGVFTPWPLAYLIGELELELAATTPWEATDNLRICLEYGKRYDYFESREKMRFNYHGRDLTWDDFAQSEKRMIDKNSASNFCTRKYDEYNFNNRGTNEINIESSSVDLLNKIATLTWSREYDTTSTKLMTFQASEVLKGYMSWSI